MGASTYNTYNTLSSFIQGTDMKQQKQPMAKPKHLQKVKYFTPRQGVNSIRLLKVPRDTAVNSPEVFMDFFVHRSNQDFKITARCGSADNSTLAASKKCWMCANALKTLEYFRRELRVFFVVSEIQEGVSEPLIWTPPRCIYNPMLTWLSSDLELVSRRSGRLISFERTGDGFQTRYKGLTFGGSCSIPADIWSKLVPFSAMGDGVWQPYSEDLQKLLYEQACGAKEEQQAAAEKAKKEKAHQDELAAYQAALAAEIKAAHLNHLDIKKNQFYNKEMFDLKQQLTKAFGVPIGVPVAEESEEEESAAMDAFTQLLMPDLVPKATKPKFKMPKVQAAPAPEPEKQPSPTGKRRIILSD